jgi:hypothetical protein
MRIKVYLFSKYAKARAQSFSVFVLSIFVSIRLYKYGYAQVKLRKMGWNNKEMLLKINM